MSARRPRLWLGFAALTLCARQSAAESDWARVLDGFSHACIRDVLPTTEGRTLLVGEDGTHERGWYDDAVVAMVDADGGLVWKRAFGGSGSDRFRSVTSLPSGDCLIAGSTRSAGYIDGIWAMRVSMSGKPLWKRAYRVGMSYAWGLVESRGDAVAVLGGDSLISLNSSGAPLWQMSYNFPITSYPLLRSLAPVSDGGWFVTALSTCARLDALGRVRWSRDFRGTEFRDAVQTEDGGFLLVGYSIAEGTSFAMHLDSVGTVQWCRSYRLPDTITLLAAVRPAGDGGFVLAGDHRVGYYHEPHALCIKIDAKGSVAWARALPSDAGESYFVTVHTTSGRGIILGGTVPNSAYRWRRDGLVVKLPADGEAVSCSAWLPRVSVNSKPITLSLGARGLEATRVTPESTITDVLAAVWDVVSSDPCAMIMSSPVRY